MLPSCSQRVLELESRGIFADEFFVHAASFFGSAQGVRIRPQVTEEISHLGVTSSRLRLKRRVVAILLNEALIVFEGGLQNFPTASLRIAIFAHPLFADPCNRIDYVPSLARPLIREFLLFLFSF